MTNAEYYKDTILALVNNDNRISFALTTDNKIVTCGKCTCTNCVFYKKDVFYACINEMLKWMCQEYIEKPTITTRERQLLEFLKGTDFKYFARNESFDEFIKNETFYAYSSQIGKDETDGKWYFENPLDDNKAIRLNYLNVDFSFIKYTDDKPWYIDDLLALEVKD